MRTGISGLVSRGKNYINKNIPKAFIKLLVAENGFKNQQGRKIILSYPNGRKKAMLINGGSGYLSDTSNEITVLNDSQSTLKIEFFCKNKKINFEVINGKVTKDVGN